MSFPTKPAFVHYGDWSESTAKHPAVKWMEVHTYEFDTRTWESKRYTSDFTYVAPDGQVHEGRDKALEAIKTTYAPLTAQCHRPYFMVCTETEEGYDMIGQATLYANLSGEPAAGESKVTDKDGKKWDLAIPGAFHFWCVKTEDGFLLKRTEMHADTGPLVMGLLKRGVISPKHLGL
jgi:hypothetical protein